MSYIGMQGPSGKDGAMGLRGPAGFIGPQGPPGVPGETGKCLRTPSTSGCWPVDAMIQALERMKADKQMWVETEEHASTPLHSYTLEARSRPAFTITRRSP